VELLLVDKLVFIILIIPELNFIIICQIEVNFLTENLLNEFIDEVFNMENQV